MEVPGKPRIFFGIMRSSPLKTAACLLVLLLLVPNISLADERVREEILDNGLKVLILEDHTSPTATFQVWYRVGGADDPPGRKGLSHLLEHMMFKGTEKYGPKTFSQTIKRAGGRDNAFTGEDYTGYFQLLASDRIGVSIEMESDRMTNLLLTEADTLSERDVVKEERRMRYEDNPQSLVYEEVMAAAFKTHPHRHPVIGWMTDLGSITRDDLAAHYSKFYSPDNAVVIVVGDVDGDAVLEDVRKSFGGIPGGRGVKREKRTEAPQYGERRVYVKKPAQLPYILSVYKVPGLPEKDGYALDVLSTILSAGESSRLYRSLVRDDKLALSAWAAYDGLSNGPALFYLGGTATPGNSAETLESALLEQVRMIRENPPSEREVQKARNQAEASFIMEQDSIYMQAKTLGMFEMTVGWRLIDKYLDGLRAVTPEDVSRVAEKYLVAERRTTGILVISGTEKDEG